MEISLRASQKLVMSVRRTNTRLPSRAKASATARLISGTSRHSTVGSAAVCIKKIERESASLCSNVSLKKR